MTSVAFILSFESSKNDLVNNWFSAMLILHYELIAMFNWILKIFDFIFGVNNII